MFQSFVGIFLEITDGKPCHEPRAPTGWGRENRTSTWPRCAEYMEYILELPPHPVRVTTRIITFLVGDPYKPSFATVTGSGVDRKYIPRSSMNHIWIESGRYMNWGTWIYGECWYIYLQIESHKFKPFMYQLLQDVTWIDSPNGGHLLSALKRSHKMGPKNGPVTTWRDSGS